MVSVHPLIGFILLVVCVRGRARVFDTIEGRVLIAYRKSGPEAVGEVGVMVVDWWVLSGLSGGDGRGGKRKICGVETCRRRKELFFGGGGYKSRGVFFVFCSFRCVLFCQKKKKCFYL